MPIQYVVVISNHVFMSNYHCGIIIATCDNLSCPTFLIFPQPEVLMGHRSWQASQGQSLDWSVRLVSQTLSGLLLSP